MKSKKMFQFLAVVLSLCIISCGDMNKKSDNSAAMEKNMEAMKNVYAAFESGNSDNIGNWVADNIVDHSPDPNVKSTGIDGIKETIKMFKTSFPDMKQNVTGMWADKDMVIAHFNMKGMNSGPMGPMPATNKSVDVNGVDIIRFENGKAVEHWGYWEETKMMQQMGMMPEMGTAGDPSKMAVDEKMKMEEKKK